MRNVGAKILSLFGIQKIGILILSSFGDRGGTHKILRMVAFLLKERCTDGSINFHTENIVLCHLHAKRNYFNFPVRRTSWIVSGQTLSIGLIARVYRWLDHPNGGR
jgi:hypothetical protein